MSGISSGGTELINNNLTLRSLNASSNPGNYSIALGENAQNNSTQSHCVSIGYLANKGCGANSIGIGYLAGHNSGGSNRVAIGYQPHGHAAASNSIGIGYQAGGHVAGEGSITIGYLASQWVAGDYSIAIGYKAGDQDTAGGLGGDAVGTHDNSIVLNATGSKLNATQPGFVVAPVREATNSKVLYYDTTSKEITYHTAPEASLTDYSDASFGNVEISGNFIVNDNNGNYAYLGKKCGSNGSFHGYQINANRIQAYRNTSGLDSNGNFSLGGNFFNVTSGEIQSQGHTGTIGWDTSVGTEWNETVHDVYSSCHFRNIGQGSIVLYSRNSGGFDDTSNKGSIYIRSKNQIINKSNNNLILESVNGSVKVNSNMDVTGSIGVTGHVGLGNYFSLTYLGTSTYERNSSSNGWSTKRFAIIRHGSTNVFGINSDGYGFNRSGWSTYQTFSNSDDRMKHNEININNGLNIIRQLKPQKYQKTYDLLDANYIGDLSGYSWEYESGLIAQEILEINDISFVVNGGDYYDESNNLIEHPYGVNYNSIFTYNIAATKELDNIVQTQQNEINSLTSEISNLKEENTLLKSKLNEILTEMGKTTI